MKKHYNFYAVAKGRCVGIYSSWSECLTQVDGYKHNSFKGFNTLAEAVNFMVTAGISVQEIDIIVNEGEVIMKRSLMSVRPNIVDEMSKLELKSDLPNEIQLEDGIQCISIDGSCRKNGTENAVAGYGIFWGENHPNNISEDIPVTDLQTNQTAELTAAVRAVQQVLEQGIERVCIKTDSAYVHKGITSWINNWMENGWKTAQGAEVKHRALWENLYDQCKKVYVIWKHVKGHAGDPGNEAADKLSKMATDRQKETITRNVKEKVLAPKKLNSLEECTETDQQNTKQTEIRSVHATGDSKDLPSESEFKIPSKSVGKQCDSSTSVITQTYPSKLEIQPEELLSAFKSMEMQVLKIVEQSYIDQIDSEKSGLQKENLWLKDKIKDLDDLLKNEKKEKERLQREVKHQVNNKEPDDYREKELKESNRKRQTLEAEVQNLKQERDRNLSEIRLQQEKCVSARKMLESVRKDLEYTNERLVISQKESVSFQEKIAQLHEKEEKQHEEIKELKRQISIRDDIIQKEGVDSEFTDVSHGNSRNHISKATSSSRTKVENNQNKAGSTAKNARGNQLCTNNQEETESESKDAGNKQQHTESKENENNTGYNQKNMEPQEVITVNDEDVGVCQADKTRINTEIKINADILLIGTSIIKDIDTQRMSHETIVKKHVLQQKTIEGALKFVTHLEGNIKTFLLQIGSNDLEQSSSNRVCQGIEKVIKLIQTKFPESKILVSGLLPRWKVNPRDGMDFKNKKSEVNDKLSCLPGITFCTQDNFNRHMFYDGTHLNQQGTAQLVSNYKYWIGKSTGSTRTNGNNAYRRERESTGNIGTRQYIRPNFSGAERQRDSYAYRARQRPNVSRSTPVENPRRDGSDNKLFSLVKLLKEIINTD